MAQVGTMADNNSVLPIVDFAVNCIVCSVQLNPKYWHKVQEVLVDNWEFCYSRNSLKREKSGKLVKFYQFAKFLPDS